MAISELIFGFEGFLIDFFCFIADGEQRDTERLDGPGLVTHGESFGVKSCLEYLFQNEYSSTCRYWLTRSR